MLWDIIRDFIVQYITGGTNSNDEIFYTYLGGYYDDHSSMSNIHLIYQVGVDSSLEPQYLSLSDWLATTITAIIMILFVVFAVWLVRWVFKAVSSAFLLK